MKAQVLLDEARHEVVAVVIAGMAMELQRPGLGGRYLGQGVDAELFCQEGIVQSHVYPGRQGLAVVVTQQLAGVPLLPQQRIVAEVGA